MTEALVIVVLLLLAFLAWKFWPYEEKVEEDGPGFAGLQFEADGRIVRVPRPPDHAPHGQHREFANLCGIFAVSMLGIGLGASMPASMREDAMRYGQHRAEAYRERYGITGG